MFRATVHPTPRYGSESRASFALARSSGSVRVEMVPRVELRTWVRRGWITSREVAGAEPTFSEVDIAHPEAVLVREADLRIVAPAMPGAYERAYAEALRIPRAFWAAAAGEIEWLLDRIPDGQFATRPPSPRSPIRG